MKKQSWSRIWEACAFVALACAVIFCAARVVERKESYTRFASFLDSPQDIDVLFIGDSRFMNGMLPMELFAEYGFAGYNLSCYGNSIPVTYWSLMNALDYASPKLVVLAINGVGDLKKVSGSSADLHTALDFFPLTRTKARAIEDLMYDPEFPDARDDEGKLYSEIKWEYYFTLGKYHGRFSDLTREDFFPQKKPGKGGESLVGVMVYEDYEIFPEDSYAEEMGHGFAYLRRIIEECDSRGIELALLNLPHPSIEKWQKRANTVSSIAEEYGVPYLDFVQMDSIVDYSVDCYDEEPHLNASGTQKMTAYLGSYIAENYNLPDRRQEARYASWRRELDAYRDRKNGVLAAQEKLDNVLLMLHDEDYDAQIYVGAQAAMYNDDLSIRLMHNIARERVLFGEEYEKASSAMYPLEGFDRAMWEYLPYALEMRGGSAAEYTGQAAEDYGQITFGRVPEDTAVLIRALDRRTGETAAEFAF